MQNDNNNKNSNEFQICMFRWLDAAVSILNKNRRFWSVWRFIWKAGAAFVRNMKREHLNNNENGICGKKDKRSRILCICPAFWCMYNYQNLVVQVFDFQIYITTFIILVKKVLMKCLIEQRPQNLRLLPIASSNQGLSVLACYFWKM